MNRPKVSVDAAAERKILGPEFELIPRLGTCRADLRFTARLILDALGVNYGKDKRVDPVLVLEHGIANVRLTLGLVISSLDRFEGTAVDLTNETYTLQTIDNTLALLAEGVPTLTAMFSSEEEP